MKVVMAFVAASVAGVQANNYPSAVAHGMGDSCFNEGMQEITELIGNTSNAYAKCIPTGDTQTTDTLNGFLMTMDHNVDAFAERIRKDATLSAAPFINCVGFSQGNSLCRGYIHKYNDPPVATFLSVHGTVSGVAGFPNCNPSGLLGPVCKQLADLCGDAAYNPITQNILFQVDYYRDPLRVNTSDYKKYSQIAQWNNEGDSFNQTYKDNFVKVKKFAMIKALHDTMVFPNEGEWWGHYADGSQKEVLQMRDTKWYQDDLFGLKTVDEAGKIVFNTTNGEHLQFKNEQLEWWVENYFVGDDAEEHTKAEKVSK